MVKIYPNDGDMKQPLSTRVTVFFSEEIDLGTVNTKNLIVRKNGCAAVDGVFSKSSINAVSFGPRQPLEANATYEVVVPAGGLKDLGRKSHCRRGDRSLLDGSTVEVRSRPPMPEGAAGGPASTAEAGAPVGAGGAGGAAVKYRS